MLYTIRESRLRTHPSVQRTHADDTKAIMQSRNRAARKRHCNGNARPRRAVTFVTEDEALRDVVRRMEEVLGAQHPQTVKYAALL